MKITDKQLQVINYIENNLNVKFTGKTKKDANEFISSHINDSKNKYYSIKAREYMMDLYESNEVY